MLVEHLGESIRVDRRAIRSAEDKGEVLECLSELAIDLLRARRVNQRCPIPGSGCFEPYPGIEVFDQLGGIRLDRRA